MAGWDGFPLADWCRQTFGLPASRGQRFRHGRTGRGPLRGRTRHAGSSSTRTSAAASAGPWSSTAGFMSAARASPRSWDTSPGPRGRHARNRSSSWSASGWAIAAAARADADLAAELARQYNCPADQLTAKMVAEAAGAGNEAALAIFRRATQTYGWAIAQMITLLSPEVVVIGGGVPLAGEALFFAPLRQRSSVTSSRRFAERTASRPPNWAKRSSSTGPWLWPEHRPKTATPPDYSSLKTCCTRLCGENTHGTRCGRIHFFNGPKR